MKFILKNAVLLVKVASQGVVIDSVLSVLLNKEVDRTILHSILYFTCNVPSISVFPTGL